MSFNKYLNSKKIDKTIDPGNGDSPESALIAQNVKNEASIAVDLKETSLSLVVSDAIEEAEQVQLYINKTINDIIEENRSDSGFMEYVTMIKENHFDPTILIKDPSARPKIVHSPNSIKAAERDVYHRLVDPRASFIQDLYNHSTDAGSIQYMLSTYWKTITDPNGLYTEFDSSHTAPKLALGKEVQHLRQLKDSTERINNNKLKRLSHSFLEVFADRLIDRIYINAPREQISQINGLIRLLKQIKSVLVVVAILNVEDWEKFSANLKDIFSDTLQLIGSKIARVSAYSFVGGLQNNIFEFLDDFENILPIDINLQEVPECSQFFNQIYATFASFTSQIEDDLVYREGIQIKLEENRQILISNSQKQSKTKQFIHSIETSIQFLEEAKSLLSNINYELVLDSRNLAKKLLDGLDSYSYTTAKDSPVIIN